MSKLLTLILLSLAITFIQAQEDGEDGGNDASYEPPVFREVEDVVKGDPVEDADESGVSRNSLTGGTATAVNATRTLLSNPQLMQTGTAARGLCRRQTNLAPQAIPSGSGGGVGTYGPANMNDLQDCEFYWPTGTTATIQYRWRRAVNVDHFVILTDWEVQPQCAQAPFCTSGHGFGRGVASGRVQYWNGGAWVTHGSFTNTGTHINYDFGQCITTTAIRVVAINTHNCGQATNPVIYEWSVCECEKLDLCRLDTNLAPFATPSGSGGGVGTYGPANMNDLSSCQWYWPSGNNEVIAYEWKAPVNVQRFVLMTDPACVANAQCSPNSIPNAGRGVAQGVVWWWNLNTNAWVADGTFTSGSRLITYNLRRCVETTKLRITGLTTHNCGQQSNPVVYEWSVCCCRQRAAINWAIDPWVTANRATLGLLEEEEGAALLEYY